MWGRGDWWSRVKGRKRGVLFALVFVCAVLQAETVRMTFEISTMDTLLAHDRITIAGNRPEPGNFNRSSALVNRRDSTRWAIDLTFQLENGILQTVSEELGLEKRQTPSDEFIIVTVCCAQDKRVNLKNSLTLKTCPDLSHRLWSDFSRPLQFGNIGLANPHFLCELRLA